MYSDPSTLRIAGRRPMERRPGDTESKFQRRFYREDGERLIRDSRSSRNNPRDPGVDASLPTFHWPTRFNRGGTAPPFPRVHPFELALSRSPSLSVSIPR